MIERLFLAVWCKITTLACICGLWLLFNQLLSKHKAFLSTNQFAFDLESKLIWDVISETFADNQVKCKLERDSTKARLSEFAGAVQAGSFFIFLLTRHQYSLIRFIHLPLHAPTAYFFIGSDCWWLLFPVESIYLPLKVILHSLCISVKQQGSILSLATSFNSWITDKHVAGLDRLAATFPQARWGIMQ